MGRDQTDRCVRGSPTTASKRKASGTATGAGRWEVRGFTRLSRPRERSWCPLLQGP